MANQPTPDYLAGLSQLSHRSICGGLDKQEIFYRADEVAALIAKLTAPLADAELRQLAELEAIATPGPWLYAPDWLDWVVAVRDTRPGYTDDWLRIAERANNNPADRQQANFRLIAAMRNALPGLLAAAAAPPQNLEPKQRAAHLVALAAGLLEMAAGQAERPALNPNPEQALYTATTEASAHLRAAERLLLGILETNPEQPAWAFQQCGECGFSTVQPSAQARLMCPICAGDKGEEEWMSKRTARLLDKPEGRDLRREDQSVAVEGDQSGE